MVDLWGYRATSQERNFIEGIIAPIFGGSFSNRDNVRTPIQFRRESQPHHLKTGSFSQEQMHPFSHQ